MTDLTGLAGLAAVVLSLQALRGKPSPAAAEPPGD
jgi:hypothetical protein